MSKNCFHGTAGRSRGKGEEALSSVGLFFTQAEINKLSWAFASVCPVSDQSLLRLALAVTSKNPDGSGQWSVGRGNLVLRTVALGLRPGFFTYRLSLSSLHQATSFIPDTSLRSL